MMRSFVETSRTAGAPSSVGRTVEGHGPVSDKLVLTKLTDTEDMEAFLTTFERLMIVYGVAEDRRAIKLAPQLTGRALEVYAALRCTEVHLEIDGVGVEAIVPVSKTLPVSALISTDIAQHGPLLKTTLNPNQTNHQALVVTRAQPKRRAAEEDDKSSLTQSKPHLRTTTVQRARQLPLLEADKITRCEERLACQKLASYGLMIRGRLKNCRPTCRKNTAEVAMTHGNLKRIHHNHSFG